ncbi:hypothetical protein PSAR109036_01805 [Psychrobacter arenosus]|uniref:hypothetical protein n=1 Tax=Psychrobacter arenosus TaxID=256326 RepID=UPI00191A9609|nr:hypothetical protein [Psychrobacter arenosus]
MPTINDIKDIHLDSRPSIALLETIEAKHSAWGTSLRIATNHADGFEARNELGQFTQYQFAPLIINKGSVSDDLDQSLNITLGDLGEILPPLIKQIRDADSDEMPSVTYRAYAYDVASMSLAKETPIDIIKNLPVQTMSRDHQGTTFEAKTESKNAVVVGRTFNPNDYQDLKGLL